MKLSNKLYIALASALLVLGISPVFGELSQDQENTVQAASTECNMPAALVDPEVMAKTMADTAKFTELMVMMSTPQFTQSMMNCSMESEQWATWMASATDPVKMMSAATQFMNPQLYINWMTASMNPQTYQPMYSFMNPAFYTQWMTAGMNPEFYQPMFKMMDPKWQQESTAWMMDPNSFVKFFESMYPGQVVADATAAK